MVERSRTNLIAGSAFNAQWISDLTDIFGSDNISTSNNVTTVTLTTAQGETLNIKSTYDNTQSRTTVDLKHGSNGSVSMTSTSSTDRLAYRLIKFDNGVIAFSGFQSASSAASLDAHTNAKRLIWFIADCANISDNSTRKAALKASGSGADPDSATSYTAYIGDSNAGITTTYAADGAHIVNAPLMVLTPTYIRSLPLICTKLLLKIQSTSQYNTITMNGDQYLSCATFAIPLEV